MTGTCTIVIPTYNEEKNIVNMAKAIRELYPDFVITFMDDNSTDRSKELIDALGDPNIRVIVRDPAKRGLAASVFDGILQAKTDYFMTIDCDFQHPPSALGDMFVEMEKGNDLCIGTRNNRFALGFKRWAGSWAFNLMADLYLFRLGKPHPSDIMSGLFAGRCDVFAPVIRDNFDKLEMKGWKVLMDLLKYGPNKLKISTIKYDFGKRAEGESHISPMVVVTTFHQMGPFYQFMGKVYQKLMVHKQS